MALGADGNFVQALVDFKNTDLVREFSPSALNFRVFLRAPTRVIRLPISEQHVLVARAPGAIENIAAEAFLRKGCHDFAHGAQSVVFFSCDGLKNRN